MRAIIRIDAAGRKEAMAMAKSLHPDDATCPPGLRVRTIPRGKRIVSTIDCRGKLETFVATVDDLLSALQVAEKSLGALKGVR